MEDYFFDFKDFKVEIEKKLASQLIEAETLFKQFSTKLAQDHKLKINNINELFKILSTLPYKKNYLSHPIRVAHSLKFIIKNQNIKDINFALCHNIIENGFLNKVKNQYLTDDQVNKIEILTINRKNEGNKKYLDKYYDKIENHSEELILFKALDKLDNTLLGTVFHFNDHHINVIKKQVCPRVKKYNLDIAKYLDDLVDYIVANR